MSEDKVASIKDNHRQLPDLQGEPLQSASEKSDSETVASDAGPYIRGGLLFLLLTLGVFSAWAAWAPLSSAIVAQGEVMVDTYRKSIQHLEGGIIENIYVRNGDRVTGGEPLIQLQTTQWLAEKRTQQKRFFTTLAELQRLRAEQLFSEQLVFSDELLMAAQKDDDVADVLQQQQQLHRARVSAYAQEMDALRKRVEQINEQVRGLDAQLPLLDEQISSLRAEQHAFSTLFEEGLGDGQRARELNRQALQLQNERARISSERARLLIQAIETELQLATRQQDFLKEVGEQIKQVQGQYFDLQESLSVAVDRVKRATLRAPEEGVVVNLQVHTLGAVAGPGEVLLDLVPVEDLFVVEARVQPQEVDDLYEGQPADIRFTAFNQRQTKVIEAKVVKVSADRLIDEQTGEPYFLTRLRLTDQGEADMTDAMQLRAGMPAEVMIKRGERTFFSYLIRPIADSMARGLTEK